MSAATTQAPQAAPAGGMRRIPLTLESYQHPSVQLSSKLLLNMFGEPEPSDARSLAALIPMPGIDNFLSVGTGPIHAINDDQPGTTYVVSGTHFFLLTPNTDGSWSAADLGDIGTPSGGVDPAQQLFYSIAVGPTAAVVCCPPNAFVSSGGSPVALVTTTWPDYGASSVTYLDGYYVFTGLLNSQFFFITTLGDPTAVDALDFAALDAFPNAMEKVLTLGTDLWFGGATGWEIWYDAGAADFPFRRRPNGIIQRSVISPMTIAKGDESIWWWSANGSIYRTVGYHEKKISTYGIESLLTDPAVSSFVYSIFGHVFYVLNFSDKTLIYDGSTDTWHNASSSADGNGPWRANCATANQGTPFLGDSTAGRILVPVIGLSTDMGVAVRRQIVLPPLYPSTNRGFCARLEIEMEVGGDNTPGDITLDWSDDGGITFTGGPRTLNVGASTEFRKRVYTTRLGSFRNRVFRITSQHFMTIYAVSADITMGAS
jgi:hypothetical protein